MAAREIIGGRDQYKSIEYRNGNGLFNATYLDLWISIILKNEFMGDWKKMESCLCKLRRFPDRDGLIHYLRLLRDHIQNCGIAVEDIIGSDSIVINREGKKAKNKILGCNLQERDRNDLMSETPRKELEYRAMRGYWNHFSVHPNDYAKPIESKFKSSGYYSQSQSWALSSKLSSFIDKSLKRASVDNTVSLYRAFLSVLLEKMNMIDDSSGTIGDLYADIFGRYVGIDCGLISMERGVYFRDLIELIVWKDFGLTDSVVPGFFEKLATNDVKLVEEIIQDLFGEVSMYCELEYQAEEALTLLGELYTNQKMFEMFVPMSEKMGTRAWKRITTMAEMAMKHNEHELALRVYEACLTTGQHEKFLRKKYDELKVSLIK